MHDQCAFLVCRHARGGCPHPRHAIGGFVVPIETLIGISAEDIARQRYECGADETLTVFEVTDIDSRVRAWTFDIEWRREVRELKQLMDV